MNHDEIVITPKKESISKQLWFNYAPYWPLFLVLLMLTMAGAWMYLRYTPPVYESNASIIIKDGKKGIEDSKIIGELNQLAAPTIVENELEILKSRGLMGEVVNSLTLYAPVYEEGKVRAVDAYASSPVRIEVQNPDSLVETDKVYFKYDVQKNQVIIDGRSYAVGQWVNTPYGSLRFTPNKTRTPAQLPTYFYLVDPKLIVADVLSKLDVVSNKLSSVVNLTLEDVVPSRSEDILNELLRVYNRAAVNDKNVLATNTLGFVEERLGYVAKDLDSIEKQLQQYKSRMGAIDIGQQGRSFLENVSTNDQKLSEVNMKLSVLGQVEQYVYSNDKRGGIVPSTLGIDDPLLTSLLTKLYDSELQYDKLRQTMGENSPEVLSVADQIQKIKPSILENIRSQMEGLKANKSNLYSTNSGYNSFLQTLPQQERRLVEISREQNVKSSIYNYLLQKREEAALSHSVAADTRLIDNAQSSFEPVRPRKNLIYIMAFALAIGLGAAIISLRRMFNRTVMFRHEIESMTSFPVIGELGLEKKMTPLVLEKGSTTFVAEQFRKMRVSLGYMGIGPRRKKIMVTSTISGEGKSFVTTNLGLSLAMTGKKTVIVEFDLSNPTIASNLGFSKEMGISDYLKGDAELKDIIKPVSENENLFLIPAGNLPDDPSDFIHNSNVLEFFTQLESVFDYVLVDTAPVGLLSDGYVLSKYCDITLYVIRHRYTPKVMLERLDENNRINELKNLALVFNGVSSRGVGRDYGYGYGYGYNYIDRKYIDRKEKGKLRILGSGNS